MDMKNELLSCFEFMNLKLEEKVLVKSESLCKKYDVEPEELCNIWCAYAASTMCTEAPTVEKLELLERKELQKLNKEKPFPKTPIVEQQNRDFVHENLIEEHIIGRPGTFKNIDHIENELCETDLPVGEFFDDFVNNQENSTQCATKYADRQNALRIKLQVGKNIELPQETREIVSISQCSEQKPLTYDTNQMYQVLGQQRICLNSITNRIGTSIAKKNNITLPDQKTKRTHIGSIVTYGRIVKDSRERLDLQSIMLEGTIETNFGQCVNMNINKLQGTALFPGQIVLVKGKMLSEDQLIAENLYTDASCDLPPKPPITKDPLRIIAAAGPFTLDENLSYDPMRDLLNYVANEEPDVLILMGPFVDESHPTITDPDIATTFEDFFEDLIRCTSEALQDTNIQIVIISSNRDVNHSKVYPTPPYKLREKYNNVKCFPDPCLLEINNLILGVTTTDIMYHIAKEEVVTSENMDTLTRLPTYILQQRSFYPLYPPYHKMHCDNTFLEEHGMMECSPHILLLPSKFKAFAKNIQGCVVLNPERLTKGNTGGTFTDVTILPGGDPIVERLNCKILNI